MLPVPQAQNRRLFHSSARLTSDGTEQIVGRERRGRVSQLAWCSEGCFDSRRRVNSTVGLLRATDPALLGQLWRLHLDGNDPQVSQTQGGKRMERNTTSLQDQVLRLKRRFALLQVAW